MKRLMQMKRMAKDEQGAIAIEFVIVAPVLFTLMMGIVEFGFMMATQSVLESAVAETARNYKALSRQREGGNASANIDQIRAKILDIAGKMVNPSELHIEANTLGYNGGGWGNAGGIYNNYQSQGEANAAGAGGCEAGNYNVRRSCSGFNSEVIQYQVRYDYKFAAPLISKIIPKVTLRASTVVQNEPNIN